ncbi:unnamed protein product [Amoebophrya sp. A120]|nr:unnamed protein product [Amoebophrya sp. A120]|eukprot:GSA120T00025186001.1
MKHTEKNYCNLFDNEASRGPIYHLESSERSANSQLISEGSFAISANMSSSESWHALLILPSKILANKRSHLDIYHLRMRFTKKYSQLYGIQNRRAMHGLE